MRQGFTGSFEFPPISPSVIPAAMGRLVIAERLRPTQRQRADYTCGLES
jgi:hypothetical protein